MAISSRASAILNRHKRQHWWLQRYELFLTPQNKTRNSCSKPIVRVFFGSYPLPLTLIDCLWTMALGYSWVCSPPTFSRDRWVVAFAAGYGISRIIQRIQSLGSFSFAVGPARTRAPQQASKAFNRRTSTLLVFICQDFVRAFKTLMWPSNMGLYIYPPEV